MILGDLSNPLQEGVISDNSSHLEDWYEGSGSGPFIEEHL